MPRGSNKRTGEALNFDGDPGEDRGELQTVESVNPDRLLGESQTIGAVFAELGGRMLPTSGVYVRFIRFICPSIASTILGVSCSSNTVLALLLNSLGT